MAARGVRSSSYRRRDTEASPHNLRPKIPSQYDDRNLPPPAGGSFSDFHSCRGGCVRDEWAALPKLCLMHVKVDRRIVRMSPVAVYRPRYASVLELHQGGRGGDLSRTALALEESSTLHYN